MAKSLFIGSSNVRRYWGCVPSILTKTATQITCTTLTTLSASLANATAQTTFCVIEVLPNFIVDCSSHLVEDHARLLAIRGMFSEFVDLISPYAESLPKVFLFIIYKLHSPPADDLYHRTPYPEHMLLTPLYTPHFFANYL